MDSRILLVIIVIAVGFDFLNGFHDAANSIATVVATHVLSPFAAVVIGSQGLPAVKKSEGNTP